MTTLAFFTLKSQAAQERDFWLMLLVIPTLCWLLVRLRKWLGVIAVPLALFAAYYCLPEVNRAITDHEREHPWAQAPWARGYPDYGYMALAFAAATAPFIAIRTAYMWPRNRPNQRPDGTSAKAPPSNPSQGAAVPHP